MWRLTIFIFAAVLLASCAVTEEKEGLLTVEQRQQLLKEMADLQKIEQDKKKELEDVEANKKQCENEIAAKQALIDEKTREINELLKKTIELMKDADDLSAAYLLLLEARAFEKQNPAQEKTVIADKYKTVFEKYPETKAGKEAQEKYLKLIPKEDKK